MTRRPPYIAELKTLAAWYMECVSGESYEKAIQKVTPAAIGMWFGKEALKSNDSNYVANELLPEAKRMLDEFNDSGSEGKLERK